MVAIKEPNTVTRRAKLISEMGLITRDGAVFHVKSPTRANENSRVWRDNTGRVRCSCRDFEEYFATDQSFRCEHILAVKYHLESPAQKAEQTKSELNRPIEIPVNEIKGEEEMQKGVTEKGRTAIVFGEEVVVEDLENDTEMEASGTVYSFPTLLRELSTPIPKEYVRQRVGWVDRSGAEHEIDYVEWHTVADTLDRVYPQWSHSVKDIKHIGDLVAVTASITIMGVKREGVGTGYAWDEKGIKKAEHDALKRAAVKFGIARDLYKRYEEEVNANANVPRDPLAKTLNDLVTPKQLAAIRAISSVQGVDAEKECQELLGCKVEELSRRAASALIDHLKTKSLPQTGVQNEVRRVS
ncbi:MAG: SWIM zinc finger family protein [Blastocatellia bacterium]|nr:SWIM zinc finger family protein [Blastocatellia bacterium]